MDPEFRSNTGSAIRLSAMLHVADARAAQAFYQKAFGAVVLWTAPDDGSVVHLTIGGAEFWVHAESARYLNFGPSMLGGTTVRLMLIVPDPDAVFAQALAAGATAINPVQDHEYGWRDGRLADPFGHHWEIAKPLA